MSDLFRIDSKAQLKVVGMEFDCPGDLFDLSDSGLLRIAANLGDARNWWTDDKWTAGVEERVRYCMRRMSEDEILVLSFSNLAVANPADLVRGLRRGIRLGRRDVAPRPGLVGVAWGAFSGESQVLRHAVRLQWELLDQRDPKYRLPVPFFTEYGGSILGHLPPALSSHFDALKARLITYHDLGYVTNEEKTPKELGRLLDRYRKLGLLVPRGYAPVKDLAGIGLEPDNLGPNARPQVWESVFQAIAEEEWRTLKLSWAPSNTTVVPPFGAAVPPKNRGQGLHTE